MIKYEKKKKVACSSHVGVSDMQSFECAEENEIFSLLIDN
jgi:hypothetical protein